MSRKKKLHVIGICGKGTSAVAYLMQQSGWEISGSDAETYEPIAGYLREHNIPCSTPYSADNIPLDVDMFMLGSSATLSIETNSEVARAFQMNKPIKSFAEVLSELTQNTDNIVVCGSYGKSTCTSLLAYYLEAQKHVPSYFIGAIPINLDSASKLGKSPYFVLEGDEYPHKIDDITSKFMFYHAKTVLLTSGEHDHVNKFPTIESYLKTYRELVQSLDKNSLIVCAIHHPHVKTIIKDSFARIISYGFKNADYTVRDISYGSVSSFYIYKGNENMGRFETTLLGQHNIENILATVALILEKNILSVSELQDSVKSFRGIKRRLDLKTEKSIIPVYEGFGSSYTKAKTAIDAIRLHFPDKKLITIFEPHTFGWRNRANIAWYHDVFEGSDLTLVYKPPLHGSLSHEQLSHDEIINEVRNHGYPVFAIENIDDAFALLAQKMKSNSVVLLLSSGDLGGLIAAVPKLCDENYPLKK